MLKIIGVSGVLSNDENNNSRGLQGAQPLPQRNAFYYVPPIVNEEKNNKFYPLVQFLINEDYFSLKKFCESIGMDYNKIPFILLHLSKNNSQYNARYTHHKIFAYFKDIIQIIINDNPNVIFNLENHLGFYKDEVSNWQDEMNKNKIEVSIVIDYLCKSVSRYKMNSIDVVQFLPTDLWFRFFYATEYIVSNDADLLKPFWMYKPTSCSDENPFLSWEIQPQEKDLSLDDENSGSIMYVADFLHNLLMYTQNSRNKEFMKPIVSCSPDFKDARINMLDLYQKKPKKQEDDKYMIIIRYVLPTTKKGKQQGRSPLQP